MEMLCEMKKLKSLVIIMSCVLLTGSIFPGKLFAQTVTEDWVARYDGPGNYHDWAEAMAVDDSGNVYVTGRSVGSGTGWDYATIKYAPDGNQLWAARYNGTANADDRAWAIAVDSSGNVYVTGGINNFGLGVDGDCGTVKYDPNGNELWVATYDGPAAGHDIALDSTGNVFITGLGFGTTTAYDYATIKYDTNGNELWVATYDGQGQGEEISRDVAEAIAIDSSGNVYVTGETGSQIGQESDDYVTVKYDGVDGNEVWVARYDGAANSGDEAKAIAVDSSGNVYVTGRSTGSGTHYDYATVKYDPNGNKVWAARYNGPGNGYDCAYAIALDSSGNIYVTGYGSYNYTTIKYNTNGNELWVARYNGPTNGGDAAYAIAIDSSGNVYVTGGSVGSGTGWDYATVKYDTNGNEVWVRIYNGPVDSTDIATAIAVDDSGNVYVMGHSWGIGTGIGTSGDYATIKYSQSAAVGAIQQLIIQVIGLNLQQGIENGLDAKLDAAVQALDDINQNNDTAAIQVLGAFITAVEGQRGNKISEADADDLIATAQAIIAVLSGT
jgi:uncharacterized delta-60 repeat protein